MTSYLKVVNKFNQTPCHSLLDDFTPKIDRGKTGTRRLPLVWKTWFYRNEAVRSLRLFCSVWWSYICIFCAYGCWALAALTGNMFMAFKSWGIELWLKVRLLKFLVGTVFVCPILDELVELSPDEYPFKPFLICLASRLPPYDLGEFLPDDPFDDDEFLSLFFC